MIRLRPSCLLLLICYSHVQAQCVSSHYDPQCSWLSRYTSSCQNIEKPQPLQIPYACPESWKSPQLCSCTQNLQKKAVTLVGYDVEIYDIIKDIQKEGTKDELIIVFYIFQCNKLNFLGTLTTSINTLERILKRHHHYFCINCHNIHTFPEAQNSWCVDGTIVIPSRKECQMLKDTIDKCGILDNRLWNKQLDNFKDGNEFICNGLTPEYTRNNRFSNLHLPKNAANNLKYYEFDLSGGKHWVCPPIHIHLRRNYPSGKVDQMDEDSRKSQDLTNQVCLQNRYSIDENNNVCKGPICRAIFGMNNNISPLKDVCRYIGNPILTNNGDSICTAYSPSTICKGAKSDLTQIPQKSPSNYVSAPGICNLYTWPSNFYKSNEKIRPYLNYDANAYNIPAHVCVGKPSDTTNNMNLDQALRTSKPNIFTNIQDRRDMNVFSPNVAYDGPICRQKSNFINWEPYKVKFKDVHMDIANENVCIPKPCFNVMKPKNDNNFDVSDINLNNKATIKDHLYQGPLVFHNILQNDKYTIPYYWYIDYLNRYHEKKYDICSLLGPLNNQYLVDSKPCYSKDQQLNTNIDSNSGKILIDTNQQTVTEIPEKNNQQYKDQIQYYNEPAKVFSSRTPSYVNLYSSNTFQPCAQFKPYRLEYDMPQKQDNLVIPRLDQNNYIKPSNNDMFEPKTIAQPLEQYQPFNRLPISDVGSYEFPSINEQNYYGTKIPSTLIQPYNGNVYKSPSICMSKPESNILEIKIPHSENPMYSKDILQYQRGLNHLHPDITSKSVPIVQPFEKYDPTICETWSKPIQSEFLNQPKSDLSNICPHATRNLDINNDEERPYNIETRPQSYDADMTPNTDPSKATICNLPGSKTTPWYLPNVVHQNIKPLQPNYYTANTIPSTYTYSPNLYPTISTTAAKTPNYIQNFNDKIMYPESLNLVVPSSQPKVSLLPQTSESLEPTQTISYSPHAPPNYSWNIPYKTQSLLPKSKPYPQHHITYNWPKSSSPQIKYVFNLPCPLHPDKNFNTIPSLSKPEDFLNPKSIEEMPSDIPQKHMQPSGDVSKENSCSPKSPSLNTYDSKSSTQPFTDSSCSISNGSPQISTSNLIRLEPTISNWRDPLLRTSPYVPAITSQPFSPSQSIETYTSPDDLSLNTVKSSPAATFPDLISDNTYPSNIGPIIQPSEMFPESKSSGIPSAATKHWPSMPNLKYPPYEFSDKYPPYDLTPKFPSHGFGPKYPPGEFSPEYPSYGFNPKYPPYEFSHKSSPYGFSPKFLSHGFGPKYLPFEFSPKNPPCEFSHQYPPCELSRKYPPYEFNPKFLSHGFGPKYPSGEFNPKNPLYEFSNKYPPYEFSPEYPSYSFSAKYPPYEFSPNYHPYGFSPKYPPYELSHKYPTYGFTSKYPPCELNRKYPPGESSTKYPPHEFSPKYPPHEFSLKYPPSEFSCKYPALSPVYSDTNKIKTFSPDSTIPDSRVSIPYSSPCNAKYHQPYIGYPKSDQLFPKSVNLNTLKPEAQVLTSPEFRNVNSISSSPLEPTLPSTMYFPYSTPSSPMYSTNKWPHYTLRSEYPNLNTKPFDSTIPTTSSESASPSSVDYVQPVQTPLISNSLSTTMPSLSPKYTVSESTPSENIFKYTQPVTSPELINSYPDNKSTFPYYTPSSRPKYSTTIRPNSYLFNFKYLKQPTDSSDSYNPTIFPEVTSPSPVCLETQIPKPYSYHVSPQYHKLYPEYPNSAQTTTFPEAASLKTFKPESLRTLPYSGSYSPKYPSVTTPAPVETPELSIGNVPQITSDRVLPYSASYGPKYSSATTTAPVETPELSIGTDRLPFSSEINPQTQKENFLADIPPNNINLEPKTTWPNSYSFSPKYLPQFTDPTDASQPIFFSQIASPSPSSTDEFSTPFLSPINPQYYPIHGHPISASLTSTEPLNLEPELSRPTLQYPTSSSPKYTSDYTQKSESGPYYFNLPQPLTSPRITNFNLKTKPIPSLSNPLYSPNSYPFGSKYPQISFDSNKPSNFPEISTPSFVHPRSQTGPVSDPSLSNLPSSKYPQILSSYQNPAQYFTSPRSASINAVKPETGSFLPYSPSHPNYYFNIAPKYKTIPEYRQNIESLPQRSVSLLPITPRSSDFAKLNVISEAGPTNLKSQIPEFYPTPVSPQYQLYTDQHSAKSFSFPGSASLTTTSRSSDLAKPTVISEASPANLGPQVSNPFSSPVSPQYPQLYSGLDSPPLSPYSKNPAKSITIPGIKSPAFVSQVPKVYSTPVSIQYPQSYTSPVPTRSFDSPEQANLLPLTPGSSDSDKSTVISEASPTNLESQVPMLYTTSATPQYPQYTNLGPTQSFNYPGSANILPIAPDSDSGFSKSTLISKIASPVNFEAQIPNVDLTPASPQYPLLITRPADWTQPFSSSGSANLYSLPPYPSDSLKSADISQFKTPVNLKSQIPKPYSTLVSPQYSQPYTGVAQSFVFPGSASFYPITPDPSDSAKSAVISQINTPTNPESPTTPESQVPRLYSTPVTPQYPQQYTGLYPTHYFNAPESANPIPKSSSTSYSAPYIPEIAIPVNLNSQVPNLYSSSDSPQYSQPYTGLHPTQYFSSPGSLSFHPITPDPSYSTKSAVIPEIASPTNLQSQIPKYYSTIASPKYSQVNAGPVNLESQVSKLHLTIASPAPAYPESVSLPPLLPDHSHSTLGYLKPQGPSVYSIPVSPHYPQQNTGVDLTQSSNYPEFSSFNAFQPESLTKILPFSNINGLKYSAWPSSYSLSSTKESQLSSVPLDSTKPSTYSSPSPSNIQLKPYTDYPNSAQQFTTPEPQITTDRSPFSSDITQKETLADIPKSVPWLNSYLFSPKYLPQRYPSDSSKPTFFSGISSTNNIQFPTPNLSPLNPNYVLNTKPSPMAIQLESLETTLLSQYSPKYPDNTPKSQYVPYSYNIVQPITPQKITNPIQTILSPAFNTMQPESLTTIPPSQDSLKYPDTAPSPQYNPYFYNITPSITSQSTSIQAIPSPGLITTMPPESLETTLPKYPDTTPKSQYNPYSYTVAQPITSQIPINPCTQTVSSPGNINYVKESIYSPLYSPDIAPKSPDILVPQSIESPAFSSPSIPDSNPVEAPTYSISYGSQTPSVALPQDQPRSFKDFAKSYGSLNQENPPETVKSWPYTISKPPHLGVVPQYTSNLPKPTGLYEPQDLGSSKPLSPTAEWPSLYEPRSLTSSKPLSSVTKWPSSSYYTQSPSDLTTQTPTISGVPKILTPSKYSSPKSILPQLTAKTSPYSSISRSNSQPLRDSITPNTPGGRPTLYYPDIPKIFTQKPVLPLEYAKTLPYSSTITHNSQPLTTPNILDTRSTLNGLNVLLSPSICKYNKYHSLQWPFTILANKDQYYSSRNLQNPSNQEALDINIPYTMPYYPLTQNMNQLNSGDASYKPIEYKRLVSLENNNIPTKFLKNFGLRQPSYSSIMNPYYNKVRSNFYPVKDPEQNLKDNKYTFDLSKYLPYPNQSYRKEKPTSQNYKPNAYIQNGYPKYTNRPQIMTVSQPFETPYSNQNNYEMKVQPNNFESNNKISPNLYAEDFIKTSGSDVTNEIPGVMLSQPDLENDFHVPRTQWPNTVFNKPSTSITDGINSFYQPQICLQKYSHYNKYNNFDATPKLDGKPTIYQMPLTESAYPDIPSTTLLNTVPTDYTQNNDNTASVETDQGQLIPNTIFGSKRSPKSLQVPAYEFKLPSTEFPKINDRTGLSYYTPKSPCAQELLQQYPGQSNVPCYTSVETEPAQNIKDDVMFTPNYNMATNIDNSDRSKPNLIYQPKVSLQVTPKTNEYVCKASPSPSYIGTSARIGPSYIHVTPCHVTQQNYPYKSPDVISNTFGQICTDVGSFKSGPENVTPEVCNKNSLPSNVLQSGYTTPYYGDTSVYNSPLKETLTQLNLNSKTIAEPFVNLYKPCSPKTTNNIVADLNYVTQPCTSNQVSNFDQQPCKTVNMNTGVKPSSPTQLNFNAKVENSQVIYFPANYQTIPSQKYDQVANLKPCSTTKYEPNYDNQYWPNNVLNVPEIDNKLQPCIDQLKYPEPTQNLFNLNSIRYPTITKNLGSLIERKPDANYNVCPKYSTNPYFGQIDYNSADIKYNKMVCICKPQDTTIHESGIPNICSTFGPHFSPKSIQSVTQSPTYSRIGTNSFVENMAPCSPLITSSPDATDATLPSFIISKTVPTDSAVSSPIPTTYQIQNSFLNSYPYHWSYQNIPQTYNMPSYQNQYIPDPNIELIKEKIAVNNLFKRGPCNSCVNDEIAETLVKNKEASVNLGNVCLVRYPACDHECNIIKTNNPNIFMKAWTSKIKVIKAKVVFDEVEYDVTNFMPVVKESNIFDFNAVQDVVKDIVRQSYGEPIVLKGMYKVYKPYAIVCNIDDVRLNSGGRYILWPTFDESII